MSGRHRGEPKRAARCPWPGCGKRVRPAYLMCRTHWYRLPARIRSRIWDTYQPGQTAATASPEYLEALGEALNFARETETPDQLAAQQAASWRRVNPVIPGKAGDAHQRKETP
jgi:hypothetical protein